MKTNKECKKNPKKTREQKSKFLNIERTHCLHHGLHCSAYEEKQRKGDSFFNLVSWKASSVLEKISTIISISEFYVIS